LLEEHSEWSIETDVIRDDRPTMGEDAEADLDESETSAGVSITVLHGTGLRQICFIDADGGVLGRDLDSDFQLTDPTVSRAHARLERRDTGFVIVDLDSANGTFVDGEPIVGEAPLPTACRVRLGAHTVLQCLTVDSHAAARLQQLENEIFIDPLTQTGNRRFFKRRLREELAYGARHQRTVGLLMLDIDHFKEINDEFGHVIGDRVLAEIGRILKDSIRHEDSVYRFGGEEFCILTRAIRSAGLYTLAERIRLAVEFFAMPTDVGPVRATVSVGATYVEPAELPGMSTMGQELDDDGEEDSISRHVLIERADMALYNAKEKGRNCVVVLQGVRTVS